MPNLALTLHHTLASVCPILGVSIAENEQSATFTPQASATAGQLAAATSALNAFDFSPSGVAAAERALLRQVAQAVLDAGGERLELAIKAVALLTLDEVNRHAQMWNTYRAQIAAASSLANLQQRVANNTQDLPTYTAQALVTAIKTKIANGLAD